MYKDPVHLIKRAKLESTNPLALKNFGRVGDWAARNPYMLGGLGLGAGVLGAGSMMRDKNESGPGMVGTLGTLGLLGAGGYLLDRVGGFKGLGDGMSFYNRFAGDGGPGHGMSWGDKLKMFNAWSDMSPEMRGSLGGMKNISDLPGVMMKHPKQVAQFTSNYPDLSKRLLANTAIGGASTVATDLLDKGNELVDDGKAWMDEKVDGVKDWFGGFGTNQQQAPVVPQQQAPVVPQQQPPVVPQQQPPVVPPPLFDSNQSHVTP